MTGKFRAGAAGLTRAGHPGRMAAQSHRDRGRCRRCCRCGAGGPGCRVLKI